MEFCCEELKKLIENGIVSYDEDSNVWWIDLAYFSCEDYGEIYVENHHLNYCLFCGSFIRDMVPEVGI